MNQQDPIPQIKFRPMTMTGVRLPNPSPSRPFPMLGRSTKNMIAEGIKLKRIPLEMGRSSKKGVAKRSPRIPPGSMDNVFQSTQRRQRRAGFS